MEDVGNTNVYLDKDHTATFGGFVIRGKKKGDYEPFFLKNLLCSPFSRKKIIRMGAGSQHFNIGQENLSQIHIALPTMEEQKKVASFLTLLDERIAKQSELVEHLKSYKRGVLSAIFSRKIRFSDSEWISLKVSDVLDYEQPQKYIVDTENYSDSYNTPVLTANKAFILGYTDELTGIYDKGDVIIYDDCGLSERTRLYYQKRTDFRQE